MQDSTVAGLLIYGLAAIFLNLPFLAVSPYINFEHHVVCQNKQQTSVLLA